MMFAGGDDMARFCSGRRRAAIAAVADAQQLRPHTDREDEFGQIVG
jgi:hypothetical protein